MEDMVEGVAVPNMTLSLPCAQPHYEDRLQAAMKCKPLQWVSSQTILMAYCVNKPNSPRWSMVFAKVVWNIVENGCIDISSWVHQNRHYGRVV